MGLFSTLFGRKTGGISPTAPSHVIVPTTTVTDSTRTVRPDNYNLIKTGANAAHALFTSGGPRMVGEQTIAAMDDGQAFALRGLQQEALASPLLAGAQQQVAATLAGGPHNPWIDQLWQQGVGQVSAAYEKAVGDTAASAIAVGRMGSPAIERQRMADQAALAGQLGTLHTSLYAQDFKDRQAQQQAAVGQAIALQQQQLAALAQAADAGAQFQAQQQAVLDARAAADPYTLRLQKLQDYAGMLSGFDAGSTTMSRDVTQGQQVVTRPGSPGTPAGRTPGLVGWINRLSPVAQSAGMATPWAPTMQSLSGLFR